MAETEVNVINHLLDVEHQASEMISGAQAEADKRIASSRAQAEAEYKKQYDQVIAGIEADYTARTAEIERRHNQAVESYKSEILNTAQDTKAFNKLVSALLAAV